MSVVSELDVALHKLLNRWPFLKPRLETSLKDYEVITNTSSYGSRSQIIVVDKFIVS